MKKAYLLLLIACLAAIIWGVTYLHPGNSRVKLLGRVIDENGSPLAGAVVGYRIEVLRIWHLPFTPSHYNRGEVTSKADGTFQIWGIGTTLLVGPLSKDGYRDALSEPMPFGYSGTPEPHDKDKRVDFLMVKSDVPRTKEVYQKSLNFAWNKGAVKIPLEKNLGRFELVPTREMQPGQEKGFSWNVKISMPDAELVSIADSSAQIAPAMGYKKELEYGCGKDAPQWGSMLRDSLAFKTKDGRYGLIDIYVYVERENFGVNGGLNIRVNESGKMNLD